MHTAKLPALVRSWLPANLMVKSWFLATSWLPALLWLSQRLGAGQDRISVRHAAEDFRSDAAYESGCKRAPSADFIFTSVSRNDGQGCAFASWPQHLHCRMPDTVTCLCDINAQRYATHVLLVLPCARQPSSVNPRTSRPLPRTRSHTSLSLSFDCRLSK